MYVLQCVTVFILISCLNQTGIRDFLGLRMRKEEPSINHLVTTGWYSVVRHPIYLFSLIFLMLNPVMSAQLLLLTLFSMFYFILGALVEEKRLLQQFGEEYRQYQRRVPFLLPGCKLIKQ